MISHTWTEREREFECMTDDNDDRDLKPEDDIRLTCKSHRRGAAVIHYHLSAKIIYTHYSAKYSRVSLYFILSIKL